jgi:hypothetical protein
MLTRASGDSIAPPAGSTDDFDYHDYSGFGEGFEDFGKAEASDATAAPAAATLFAPSGLPASLVSSSAAAAPAPISITSSAGAPTTAAAGAALTVDAIELFPDMPIALRTLLDRYGDLTAVQARGIVHGLSEEQKTQVRGYFLNKPEVHAVFLVDANDADEAKMYDEEKFFNDLAIFCMFRDDSDVKEFLQTRMPSLSLQRLYDLIELLIVAGFTKSLDVALKILPPNCELVDDTLFTKIEVWKYPHKARDVKSGSADRVFGSNPYGTLLTLVENDSWTGWLEFCCRIVKEYYLPNSQHCEINNDNVQDIIQTLLHDFRAIETLKLLDVLTTPDFWYEYVADKEKLKIEMQIQVHTALGKINLQEGRWPQIISNFAGKRAELKALQTIQSMVLNAEVAVRTLEQQLTMHEDVIKTYLHRFMPTA